MCPCHGLERKERKKKSIKSDLENFFPLTDLFPSVHTHTQHPTSVSLTLALFGLQIKYSRHFYATKVKPKNPESFFFYL